MSASSTATELVRGSPPRKSNFKEALQVGYVRAVAAAAGCVVAGVPEIDEGDDIILTHRSSLHRGGKASITIQLKATEFVPDGANGGYITAQMRRERYDEYRQTDVSMPHIVVIMGLPADQSEWVHASHERLHVRHAAYWVNLAGEPAREAEEPTIRAPYSQIFDDQALCRMMVRIGRGEVI